ncbi:hypothetical protein ATM99_14540 [Cellulomonas sp. B6]|nr:hypothetical protein ATM99_14540 [Cellulomonas sp. B6]
MLSVTAALATGWWAGGAVMRPPQVAADTLGPATYTVVEGTVGRAMDAVADLEWSGVEVATLDRPGKVTSLAVEPGSVVGQGDVLLTVDLAPVVVASGDVPAFRALGAGDDGPDVRQLQQMLADLGHLNRAPDGRFGSSTTAAVRAWQRASQQPVTGVVALGDLVFVPGLPARLVVADQVAVGRALSGGEVVRRLDPAPRARLRLASEQRGAMPPPGSVVALDLDGSTLDLRTAGSQVDADGVVLVDLVAADGGPACPEPCAIPYAPQAQQVRAVVELEPSVTGALVPLAALGSGPAGDAVVTLVDGERRAVQIRGSDGSRAVVDGLAVGEQIRLFGDEVVERVAPVVPSSGP